MKDINYIVDILEEIVNIPSPSGYTKQVMERIEKEVAGFGFSSAYNRKGGMLITVPGRTETVLELSAHADTLGAMVRSIRPDGTLAIVSVGGFMMQSVEGKLLPHSYQRRKDLYGDGSDEGAVGAHLR